MKVVFEKTLTENVKTELIIEPFNDSVSINIEYIDFSNGENFKNIGQNFTKEELKEFIGALLHVQSKIRK